MTKSEWLKLFEKRLEENKPALREFLFHMIFGNDQQCDMPDYEYIEYLDLKYNLVTKDDTEYIVIKDKKTEWYNASIFRPDDCEKVLIHKNNNIVQATYCETNNIFITMDGWNTKADETVQWAFLPDPPDATGPLAYKVIKRH